MESARLTRWPGQPPPSRGDLEARFAALGLSPSWWSNGPGFRYATHSHGYDKVLYCASGSITFRLEPTGRELELGPGDRLEIPAGTAHSAVVGPYGVSCAEAARSVNRPPPARRK